MNTYHVIIVWNDGDISEETVKAKGTRQAIDEVLDTFTGTQQDAIAKIEAILDTMR